MEIKFFDFGPVLLAALFVLLGTTKQGESARVEEAAVASVNQAEAVVIPGLQAMEAKVPEVGAKVVVALNGDVSEMLEDTLYWYGVDEDGKTVGGYLYYGTKTAVIAIQGCKDLTSVICLFGSSNSNLPVGTDAIGSGTANTINHN